MNDVSKSGVLIDAPSGYLDEGLFGRVFLWLFEVLPYLDEKKIYPAWRIPSNLYGVGEDNLVVPGALDLAYEPPAAPSERLSLLDLRNWHSSHLGTDWRYLHDLWSRYFKIPERVIKEADAIPVDRATLGLHYRGTDKNKNKWDSNAITHEDFLTFIQDYLSRHPEVTKVFLATDEGSFHDLLKERLSQEIIFLGQGEHHLDQSSQKRTDFGVADRAVLDALLLSRCACVISTSSALSAFAKIFSPDIEIYRCAASKLMWYGPYFPVAYIPPYPSDNPACKAILDRTMQDDWSKVPKGRSFQKDFGVRPNWAWRTEAAKTHLKKRVKRLLGMKTETHFYFG